MDPQNQTPGSTTVTTPVAPSPATTQVTTQQVPPTTPAATGGQSSASGPGSSGAAGGGTHTTPGAVPPTVPPATQPQQTQQPAADPRIAALEQQLAQYRQYEHLIPLGWAEYQRRQQVQPQQTQQPAQPQQPANPFGIPEFDDRLLDFVGKDQDGNLVLKPGAPPDALLRVQQYQEAFRKATTEFFRNPQKFIEPLVQQQAQQIADRIVQQRLGQQSTQQSVQQIMQQNADWLYAKDAQGQPATRFNPANGRHEPVLSPHGQEYARLVYQAHQMGISDPRAQDAYARNTLIAGLAQEQWRRQQGQQQGQQAAQQFVNQAAQTVNTQQPIGQVTNPPDPAPTSLKERLKRKFAESGITDQVLQQQITRTGAAA